MVYYSVPFFKRYDQLSSHTFSQQCISDNLFFLFKFYQLVALAVFLTLLLFFHTWLFLDTFDRLPACIAIYRDLLEICSLQFDEDSPQVLIDFQSFQLCRTPTYGATPFSSLAIQLKVGLDIEALKYYTNEIFSREQTIA